MKALRLPRRHAIALAAAGVAVACPVIGSASPTPSTRSPVPKSAPALFAPLAPGSVLGSWRLIRIGEVREGAISLVLASSEGREFILDVCLRDDAPGAPTPPARSARYDIFVANEGDGATRTHEEDGLAALAIAEVLRGREQAVSVKGMLTLRERLRRFGRLIIRGT